MYSQGLTRSERCIGQK